MNKKFFLGMFAAAGMLLATSCSHENLIEPESGDTATVSFVVDAEGAIGTRAIGDGSAVQTLYYVVYNQTADETIAVERINNFHGSETLELTLAKGQTYQLGFFAGLNVSPASENGDWKITFNNNTLGGERNDAFAANLTYTVSGSELKKVTLKRIVAQVNVGIKQEDFDAAITALGGTVRAINESKVELKGTFGKTYSVLGGDVTSTCEAFALESGNMPQNSAEVLKVNGENYKYLLSAYVLPAEIGVSQTVDAKFTFFRAGSELVEPIVLEDGVSNLPIKSNYRTNIIGNVLTSNVDFEIVVDAAFAGEHNSALWDGSSVSSSFTTDAEGRLHIKSAEDFALLMSSTRDANSAYIGKTFVLDTDIDFAGQTITGVGSETCNFAGIFDGNGHTISNFVIDQSGRTFYGGLFNQVSAGVIIKNLTVKGATVIANKMAGVIASSVEAGAVVENCHVEDCVVAAKIKKAGAITGYTSNGTVKDCSAKNVQVYCADPAEAESDEIVGYENAGSTVTGNTAEDVTVSRGVTTITTAAELVAAANGGYVAVGTKYVLLSDIDLQGQTIAGFGSSYYTFCGQFDGKDHTIKNFVIDHRSSANEFYTGLFNQVHGASIKNLTVEGATVIGQSMVGVIASNSEDGSVIEACHVKNSTVISTVKKAGAVVGYTSNGTVKDCSAENVTVYCADPAADQSGEVIGYKQPTTIESGNSATNVTVVRGADLVISTAAELVAFANDVNNGNTYFGKTVVLASDIDLAGIDWTPIGGPSAEADPFYGTFDGCGHTIKNLTVVEKAGADVYDAVGFFGWIDGIVKNLNFDNATVEGHHHVGVVAGHMEGNINGKIENVTVKGATVKSTYLNDDRDGDKAGVIVGFHGAGSVSGQVSNSTVEAARDGGQAIGYSNAPTSVNVTASSVTVNGAPGSLIGRHS